MMVKICMSIWSPWLPKGERTYPAQRGYANNS